MSIQHSLVLETPWKKYEKLDIQNVMVVVKLLVDVDVKTSKAEAFLILEHVLAPLPGLPKTFKDCSSDMRIVKERQSVTNSWEKTATHYRKRDREQAEEIYSILGKQMRILREERASIEMELEWEDPQGGNTGTVSTTTATTSTTTTTASTTATTASVAPSQKKKKKSSNQGPVSSVGASALSKEIKLIELKIESVKAKLIAADKELMKLPDAEQFTAEEEAAAREANGPATTLDWLVAWERVLLSILKAILKRPTTSNIRSHNGSKHSPQG